MNLVSMDTHANILCSVYVVCQSRPLLIREINNLPCPKRRRVKDSYIFDEVIVAYNTAVTWSNVVLQATLPNSNNAHYCKYSSFG